MLVSSELPLSCRCAEQFASPPFLLLDPSILSSFISWIKLHLVSSTKRSAIRLVSSCFLSLRPRYLPQHPLLEYPSCTQPILSRVSSNWQSYVLYILLFMFLDSKWADTSRAVVAVLPPYAFTACAGSTVTFKHIHIHHEYRLLPCTALPCVRYELNIQLHVMLMLVFNSTLMCSVT